MGCNSSRAIEQGRRERPAIMMGPHHGRFFQDILDYEDAVRTNRMPRFDRVTALMHACEMGSLLHQEVSSYEILETIRFLIFDRGARVNNADIMDQTALMYACQNLRGANAIMIIQWLLESGIRVVDVDYYGRTALIYALWDREDGYKNECVRFLLQHGAKPNIGPEGNTALDCYFESYKTDTEIVRLLLGYGVHVNFQNKEGRTAVMCALSMPRSFTPYDTDLCNCINILFQCGADINFQNFRGENVLIVFCRTASFSRDQELIHYLFAFGADTNANDLNGHPVLIKAIQEHWIPEVIRLLLENPQTDINIFDQKGMTALHHAVLPSLFLLSAPKENSIT
jgi:ankyrin repeat protein